MYFPASAAVARYVAVKVPNDPAVGVVPVAITAPLQDVPFEFVQISKSAVPSIGTSLRCPRSTRRTYVQPATMVGVTIWLIVAPPEMAEVAPSDNVLNLPVGPPGWNSPTVGSPAAPVTVQPDIVLVKSMPQVASPTAHEFVFTKPVSKLKLFTKIGLANAGIATSARIASTRIAFDFIIVVSIRGPPLPSVVPQPRRSSLTFEFLRRLAEICKLLVLPPSASWNSRIITLRSEEHTSELQSLR